jgi:hypothetical protein
MGHLGPLDRPADPGLCAGRQARRRSEERQFGLPAQQRGGDQAKKFQPTETLPATVIYERPEGITPADMAKAQADAEAF